MFSIGTTRPGIIHQPATIGHFGTTEGQASTQPGISFSENGNPVTQPSPLHCPDMFDPLAARYTLDQFGLDSPAPFPIEITVGREGSAQATTGDESSTDLLVEAHSAPLIDPIRHKRDMLPVHAAEVSSYPGPIDVSPFPRSQIEHSSNPSDIPIVSLAETSNNAAIHRLEEGEAEDAIDGFYDSGNEEAEDEIDCGCDVGNASSAAFVQGGAAFLPDISGLKAPTPATEKPVMAEAALAVTKPTLLADIDSDMTRLPQFLAFKQKAQALFDEISNDPITGKNADYIPALAKCDPTKFSISIVTPDGGQFSLGDAEQTFTIQSTCKPFIGLAATRKYSVGEINTLIGSHYSSLPFNAPATVPIVRQLSQTPDTTIEVSGETEAQPQPLGSRLLELRNTGQVRQLIEILGERGDLRPANAVSNFGALQSATALMKDQEKKQGSSPIATVGNVVSLMKKMARGGENRLALDAEVYTSEISTSKGNQTLARVAHFNHVQTNEEGLAELLPEHVSHSALTSMDAYTNLCSMKTTIPHLTSIFSTLANNGVNPSPIEREGVSTRERVLTQEQTEWVTKQMGAGGLYEESEDFTKRTRMTAKSGVGGAVVAFDPDTGLTIGAHSTPLDKKGNSARGMKFVEKMVESAEFKALVALPIFQEHREKMRAIPPTAATQG